MNSSNNNNNDSFSFQDNSSANHADETNLRQDAGELEVQCVQLQSKVTQLEDQLKRSIADYQNLLRRSQQEREQTRLYAAEPAMQTLIPALDNFYYALKSLNEQSSAEQLLKSLHMVWGNLLLSLETIGFKTVEGTGQPFDPSFHEAVTQIATNEHPEGTVLEVFRPGYLLNGKVLKPAQVAVAIKAENNFS